jgi:PAS domain S-box-containing protein
MKSVLFDSPNVDESGQQTRRPVPSQSRVNVPTTLIMTFLAATLAGALYEVAKQLAFPRITVWQSHAITVCLFGAASTVAVYLALRRRAELWLQVQRERAQRKRAEEALSGLEEPYRMLFERSLAGVFRGRLLSRRLLDCNDTYADILGFGSREEALSRGKLHAFCDVAEFESAKARLLNEKSLRNFEARVCGKDKTPVWVLINITLTLSEDGEDHFIEGTVLDITERKKTEEALAQERDLLHTFMDNLPDHIYFKDCKSRFLRINPALAGVFGLSDPSQAVGKTDFDFFTAEHAQQAYDDEQEIIRTGWPMAAKEEKETWRDGHVTWASTTKMALRDAQGNIIGTFGVSRDITARKEAEQALLASEEKFAKAFRCSPNAMAISTLEEGRFLEVNDAFVRMVGRRREDVLGRTALELALWVNPEDRVRIADELREVGQVSGREVLLLGGSGQIRPSLFFAETIEVRGSRCLLSATVDITDRKRAEEALQLTAQELAQAMDMASLAHWELDPATGMFTFNDRFYALYGTTAEREGGYQMSAETYAREFLFPEDVHIITDSIAKHLASTDAETASTLEHRIRRRDGETRHIVVRISPIKDSQGRTIRTRGVNQDITERKRAEQALQLSEQRLGEAMELAQVAYWEFDPASGLFTFNDRYYQLFGTTAEREGGYQMSAETYAREFLLPQDAHIIADAIAKALTVTIENSSWAMEHPIRRRDGELRHILARITTIKDAEGRTIKGRGAVQDITERKAAEEEMRKAKEAAETANRAKSDFLANMSHEIRTPMNGIIGMTELALNTPLSSEQRGYLNLVKDSADSLLTLINDVLDHSKIEAGKLSLDTAEFNLHDVLANTLRALSVRAKMKGLEISWNAKTGVPEHVIGDAGRIRQVLVNLVGNAIKFTEQGEVVACVEVESPREEDILLHFTVRDTGIGIAPEKQKLIFEAFTQADGSMTRKYGGSGLGLTISSRLVQMMDGKIWLESKLGEGSTFHFTARFGLPKGEKAEAPLRRVASLRDLRVLVADDNSTNRKILDSLLKNWMMLPQVAGNGSEALAALEQAAAAGTPFPLVLVDAEMPDGFALAEQIKQNPRLADATIIMLTSAGQRGDVARCREVGIAVYLVNPIWQSELLEAILAALGKSRAGGRPATVITRHTLREDRRKLRILLVEDNAVNQLLAARLLEKRGHIVTIASNGCEALALLKKSGFDLALMDVQMPVVNGFEATAAIRREEASSGNHLPIIAMTAHAMQGDRERCLAAGMDGYISKPIQGDELIEMAERIVQVGWVSLPETPASTSVPASGHGEASNQPQGDQGLLASSAQGLPENSSRRFGDTETAKERGRLADQRRLRCS